MVVSAIDNRGESVETKILMVLREVGCVPDKLARVMAVDFGDERGEENVLAGLVPDHHRGLEFVGGLIGAGAILPFADLGFCGVDGDVAAVSLPHVLG